MKRYEKLAESLAELIHQQRLGVGDKLPSVRAASRHYGVSAATVFKAYYLLESRGLLRAQERSGYYVCSALPKETPQPQLSASGQVSAQLKVNERVFPVLEGFAKAHVAQLGSPFPAVEFFPVAKLALCSFQANKNADPSSKGDNLSPGNLALREAIALRYAICGLSITAEDVLITDGALEGLNLALTTVTKPGDLVAVESPGFYSSFQSLQRHGLRAIEIPVHANGGMDLSALERMLSKHNISACWCMTNFQNPTGALMSDQDKQTLVALMQRFGVPLIEDDVYGELYFGKNKPKPALAFAGQATVIHCASFSKSLAPGYRIGWVVAGAYQQALVRSKLMSSLSANVPAQLGLARYLQQGHFERHLVRLRHRLQEHMHLMLSELRAQLPISFKVTQPFGGYFLWLQFEADIDCLVLYNRALEQGLSVAPGSIFSSTGEYQNYLRLNYAQPQLEIVAGISLLAKLLQAGPRPG